MNLKSLPAEERPRERLVRFGSGVLSVVELLAILLGSGTKSRSVMHLAADLLAHFQTLTNLSEASIQELQQVKGIGLAKAIQLHAAFALSLRKEETQPLILDTPEKIAALIRPELAAQKTEVLVIILLDVRLRCIHREILSKGTLTELLLHPREVFHAAIKHRAHSIVIAHNHPSGDPTPSTRDLDMTRLLVQTGKIIGIPLADHLILGKNCFVSFQARGLV